RLKVRGSVDFVCPRGWCYMTDSDLYEVKPKAEAAMWHDGSRERDMKFVLRNCRFDGAEGWRFARHHHDAMFFLIDCTFAKTMRDQEPKRVIYPLNGSKPTAADIKNNQEHDPTNIWRERFYYFNTHRDGGDYKWHRDNLDSAPGTPRSDEITAKWTFGGKWDPEKRDGPAVVRIIIRPNEIEVAFTEPVTVKGKPALVSAS